MSSPLHIVCPHCQTTNRLEPANLTHSPNCGKCHLPLFTAHPVELDEAAFTKHLERNDIPVLIDFWAPWCGPCRTMAPAYEAAARDLEPRFRVAKVNTEEVPILSSRLGIRSIPTLAVFYRGREVARQAGAMRQADIVRWAQNALSAA